MPDYDWKTFLEGWNRELLDRFDPAEYDDRNLAEMGITREIIQSGWLGFPGATEAQIAELESRLGIPLPPSYRAFLTASNGFCQPDMLVPRLFSIQEVDWLRNTDPQLVEIEKAAAAASPMEIPDEEYFIYGDDQDTFSMRAEYIPAMLQISAREVSGSAMYLLNPEIKTDEGEWEAWMMAHWLPGARRYRTFWDLMQDERKQYLRMKPRLS